MPKARGPDARKTPLPITAALGGTPLREAIRLALLSPAGVLGRLSRLSTLALLSLSVVGAWALALTVASQTGRTAVEAGFERAGAEALATEQFARKTIVISGMLRNQAQRWLTYSQPGDAGRRADVETTIRAILDNAELGIAQFGIVDAKGDVLWHSAGGHAGFSVGERDHFRRHRDGQVGPIFGRPSPGRDRLLPVSWRLADADGGFVGAAIALLRPADIAPLLANIVERDGSLSALVRLEGELLAGSHRAAPLIGQPVLGDPMREVLMRDGIFRREGPVVQGGPDRLTVGRLVPGTNLVAIGAVDASQTLQTARLLEGTAYLAAIGFTGLVILCAVLVLVAERARHAATEVAVLAAGQAELQRLHARLPAVIFLRDVAADGSSRLTYRAGDIGGVTGWTDGALDDVEDWTYLYDEHAPPRQEMVSRVLRDGSAKHHWRLRQPDGSWRHVVMRMERLSRRPDGGGEIVGYLRDASAEHSALESAAAAREELDATLALAPVVVFRARAWTCAACTWRHGRGCYREDYISGSLEQVTGWSEQALSSAGGLAAVLSPFDTVLEGIEAMKREGGWSADLTLRRPDGTTLTIRMTTRVVARPDDSALDFVGYLVDVTAEREAKARAITSARLASLGEVSGGLAHELKQPLLAIGLAVSNTQQAAEKGDLAAVRARLGRISGYVARAASVVDHLRRYARGADEDAPMVPVPVSTALDGALAVLGGTLRDAGVTLRVEIGDPVPAVLGQLVPLEQVLVNLIGNARDALASRPAGSPRLATVTAEQEGDAVLITIADNAGGIPDSVMARLFQPFVTTKGEDHGTGLGLSLCRGLVQHMGGTIAASNEGGGAVFRIRLPAAPSPA